MGYNIFNMGRLVQLRFNFPRMLEHMWHFDFRFGGTYRRGEQQT
jgi:hypothetical protein